MEDNHYKPKMVDTVIEVPSGQPPRVNQGWRAVPLQEGVRCDGRLVDRFELVPNSPPSEYTGAGWSARAVDETRNKTGED